MKHNPIHNKWSAGLATLTYSVSNFEAPSMLVTAQFLMLSNSLETFETDVDSTSISLIIRSCSELDYIFLKSCLQV